MCRGSLFKGDPPSANNTVNAGPNPVRPFDRDTLKTRYFAERKGMKEGELKALLREGRRQLFEARKSRVRPSRDDKVITSWNALMIKGYVDAYQALGKKEYLDKALQNARFLVEEQIKEAPYNVKRIFKDGKSSQQGMLDDHAILAYALVSLYQVTFDEKWLKHANSLMERVVEHFGGPSSGLFYYTGKNDRSLVPNVEVRDGVIPSSNSHAARALHYLGILFYDQAFRERAEKMGAAMKNRVQQRLTGSSNWAILNTELIKDPYEVAIMGSRYDEKRAAIQKHYLPYVLFMGSGQPSDLPLLEDKYTGKETTIYVCQDRVCKRPVKEVEKALEQLR